MLLQTQKRPSGMQIGCKFANQLFILLSPDKALTGLLCLGQGPHFKKFMYWSKTVPKIAIKMIKGL